MIASDLNTVTQFIALEYMTSPSDPLINLNITSCNCLVAAGNGKRNGERDTETYTHSKQDSLTFVIIVTAAFNDLLIIFHWIYCANLSHMIVT